MRTKRDIDQFLASGGNLDDLKRDRQNLRLFYISTDYGAELLKNQLLQLGLFVALDPEDKESIALHNYAVSMLDDMGVLDEENLLTLVDLILGKMPLAPERK